MARVCRPIAEAAGRTLLLLAAMAAIATACTYPPDMTQARTARALLQQQPLNDSLLAVPPALPVLDRVITAPTPPPEPGNRTTPRPQPPRARSVTARVGQVRRNWTASSTTVAAQQGFWRRGNLIYADKVYLTQDAGASDMPGYKTAIVAAGEDLVVYAVDVVTDDLTLPSRNVSIVAHNVACARCVESRSTGQGGCLAGSYQAAKGDGARDPGACGALGKRLVTVDEATANRQDIIDSKVLTMPIGIYGSMAGSSYQYSITASVPNPLGDSLCCASSIACGCKVDVSGLPGVSRDGKAANGRDAGNNGQPGAPGGDGGAGGSVTLRLPATSGLMPAGTFSLKIVAQGGPGGYGQEGGDGVQGAQGATGASTCSYAWGSNPGVLGYTAYCQDKQAEGIDRQAYIGATGNRGGNGGNGGDNGFNGNGGAGGTVRVFAKALLSPSVLQMNANGGAGGTRPDNNFGVRGKYGNGGGGGPGAFYIIDRKYSNPFGCWPNPCCCYERSIAQGCDGVSCRDLYDSGWPGNTGPYGSWGSDGRRWAAGSVGTPGSASSVTLNSQPGSVPAAAMRMWLSQVQVAWLSGDHDAVTTMLNLLSSVSPCSDNPTDCADISSTITVLVSQLNSGLDYYGNRPNFVPSLSLGTLQAYTCNTLLPLMQTLESSINSYQTASDDAAARKSAASAAISDMQSKLKSMKADLDQARTERDNLYSQQALLRAQRDSLRTELDGAIGVFEQAISDKIREEASKGSIWELLLDTFTDVLDLIGQVQKVATAGEIDALGTAIKDGKDVYDKWSKFLEPLPAPLNIDAIAVADSLTQMQDTYTDWSQFNATASKDRRKQVMLKEQWDKLIANYTSLDTGKQYQLTLAAYDDACGAYNQLLFVIDSKTLAIVQTEQTTQTLEAQLPQLQSNLDELMAQDEPWVAQFLYKAYETAKSAILRNLFQQAAASHFMYGNADKFTVQDTSYNGLLSKSADLQEDIFKQLQTTNPSTPTTFVRILLDNRTAPGFDAGLKSSRIDFQLSPCMPSFYAYASVFVREFRVKFIGAVAKPGSSDAALTVGLSTPGTSIVRGSGPQLTLFSYVMTPRQSDFYYYLAEDPWTKRDPGYFISEAVPPTATCAPLGETESVYSPLSPLAPWSLSFPQVGTNRGVDFSGVTAVQIEFRGSKVAPSPGGEPALDNYCDQRGYDSLTRNARVVSDVVFVAGQNCPAGTELVGGNLNAGVSASRPVYMCVKIVTAKAASSVVSDLVLAYNRSTMQQTRCPRGYDKAGVDLNLGVPDSAIAACVRRGVPVGRMMSALRVVRSATQCQDGELTGNANAGTRGPAIFLCKVPTLATVG